jgi:hypothetical protein
MKGRLQFGARSSGLSQIVSANHSGKYLVRLDLHYQSRRPLVAGTQVQKFIREKINTEKQLAALSNPPSISSASNPTAMKERLQTKSELARTTCQVGSRPALGGPEHSLFSVSADGPADAIKRGLASAR